MKRSRVKRAELARHEWYSPPAIVAAARTVMGGIDLDPASSASANAIVQATRFYSVRDDGLSKEWHGRLWLNPPYGRWWSLFVRHFAEEFIAGRVEQAVLLLATDHLQTRWYRPVDALSPITCFPTGRLRYIDQRGERGGNPQRPSVVVGVGVNPARFHAAYAPFGQVFVRLSAERSGSVAQKLMNLA